MAKQNQLILTKDGSYTIRSAQFGVDYHSIHGAVQESKHVFIEAGLKQVAHLHKIRILEMGLGTGLNAFLTLLEAENTGTNIYYTALELYPIDLELIPQLNYLEILGVKTRNEDFEKIHNSPFGQEISFGEHFHLLKLKISLLQFASDTKYNLIYFDAFAPDDQPELWTEEIFSKLYEHTDDGGILVTYCAKGSVRRTLQASGWRVQKIPGPPGKREMIRAIKGGANP